MARRRIGQERLAISGAEARGGKSLDQVASLIDWVELDGLLASISASTKGEPGWPSIALFRALLLAMWHDLSDVRLAEALDDGSAFAGSVALPRTSRRPSAPPLSGSAPSWCAAASTGCFSRRSRVSSMRAG